MNEESIEASKAPLIDHFIELRTRILRSIFVLSVTFIFAFIFSENIYLFLVNPYEEIMGSNSQMIYTAPQEFLMVKLKIALFGGLLITFPYFCLEIYSFISPGLYKKEKIAMAPYFIFSPILFLIGAVTVQFFIMPLALNFFSKLWVYSKEIRTSIESLVDDVDISNKKELKDVEKEINSITEDIENKNKE